MSAPPATAPRKRRFLRGLRMLALLGVVLLAMFAAACAWLAGSAGGTRALAEWLTPLAAPHARFAAIEGRLARRFVVHELALSLPAAEVHIERAEFAWRPHALLRGRLLVTQLALAGVSIAPTARPARAPVALATPLLVRLPVAVTVREIEVRDLAVDGVDGRLESLVLGASLDGARLTLADIALVAMHGDERATLGGSLELVDGAVPELVAALGGARESAPRQRIEVALGGPLDNLRLDAQIEGYMPLRVGGEVDLVAARPRFALSLEADTLSLGEGDAALRLGPSLVGLHGTAAAFDLALDSRLERAGLAPRALNVAASVQAGEDAAADSYGASFEWRAAAERGPWPALTGSGRLDYARDRLVVHHEAAAPLASTLRATIGELGAHPRLDATFEAIDLELPPGHAEAIELARVDVHARGALEALALTVVAHGRHPRAGPLSLALDGELAQETFTVERLDAGLLGGTAEARGQVRFTPQLGADLRISARGVDLARLAPGLDTALAASGSLVLTARDDGFDGTLDLGELAGSWRGHAVAGHLALALSGARVSLRRAHLALGDNVLDASGELDDALSGRFELVAADLGKLAPGLAGELRADGTFGGAPTAPRVAATLAGRGLRRDEWSVARLDGEVALDLASSGAQHLDLRLTGIEAAARTLGTLAVGLDGTLAHHTLELDLGGGEPSATLVARGGWQAPRWDGRLETLTLAATPLGDWSLQGASTLAYAEGRVDIARSCLGQNAARVCIALDGWTGSAGNAAVSLSELPLAAFADYLPTTIGARGRLGGAARFAATAAGLEGTAQLALERAELHAARADGSVEIVPLRETRAALTLSPALLSGRIEADLGSWLTLDGTLRCGLDAAQALEGSLRVAAAELAWIEEFVPELAGTRGAAQLAATLAGTRAQPRVTLDAGLTQGTITVPASGMRISRLELAAQSAADGELALRGALGDDVHAVTLDGRVQLDPRADWRGRVRVHGEHLGVVRLPDVEADVSPDLTLDFSAGHADLSGRLVLPRVSVSLGTLPPSAVSVSPDEVIVGAAAPAQEVPPPVDFFTSAVTGDVELVLGDEVRIDAAGLDARLAGGLRWSKQRGDRIGRGSGRVSIATGRYEAYGQELSVERGHLIFAGPIDSPELDVRAVRPDVDVVAGLLVSGNVRAPRFELFSEPPMPDAEILAWIITGHGLDNASSGEASFITSAALSLGAERASMVTSQVRDAFGLDEFGIDTGETTRDTAITAGKRLTPKLSVRSEFNPFDRLMSFFLNYKLTPSWSVEAESGVRQGADLIYSMEREELLPEDPLDPRSWLE